MASRRRTHPRAERSTGGLSRLRRPGSGWAPRAPRAPRVAGSPRRVSAPPRGLSRRAAVLAVLLLAVATAMAPFVRALVEQQSRIAALEESVAERQQEVAELDRQLERWEDPAFVIAQARQRFTYVMPGEVGYVVLDEPQAVQDQADPSRAAARQASRDDGSWFGAVWSSVELAGRAPTQLAPGPDAPTTPAPAPATTEDPPVSTQQP